MFFHSVFVLVFEDIWPYQSWFSSTTSCGSSSFSPSSSSFSSFCVRLPRCSHSFILLLPACAVYFSSVLCFPCSAMSRNMAGQWKILSSAVTSVRLVQWLLFTMIDFIIFVMQTGHERKLLCVFQVPIWMNVWAVKLTVSLALVSGTVKSTTWSPPAMYVKIATEVSSSTAFCLSGWCAKCSYFRFTTKAGFGWNDIIMVNVTLWIILLSLVAEGQGSFKEVNSCS